MNRSAIFKLMGVPPKGILLTKLEIIAWGSELMVQGLYAPWEYTDPQKPFKLVFTECKEIQWTRIESNDMNTYADVIDISVGHKGYVQPAVIHTDVFELTILYDELAIIKDWDLP